MPLNHCFFMHILAHTVRNIRKAFHLTQSITHLRWMETHKTVKKSWIVQRHCVCQGFTNTRIRIWSAFYFFFYLHEKIMGRKVAWKSKFWTIWNKTQNQRIIKFSGTNMKMLCMSRSRRIERGDLKLDTPQDIIPIE